MKCPRCQHDNREGRRFCAECGASLALACSACGFSNEPGEKFCGGCGAPLGALAGAATGSRFSSPESYTPKHLAVTRLVPKEDPRARRAMTENGVYVIYALNQATLAST